MIVIHNESFSFILAALTEIGLRRPFSFRGWRYMTGSEVLSYAPGVLSLRIITVFNPPLSIMGEFLFTHFRTLRILTLSFQ
jgi:hypothetical protein